VTIILHCPHCQSVALVRNGHAPNGKQLYRCRASERQAVRIPLPTPIPKLAARRSYMLIKNAAVSAASRTPLSLARPCPVGSKKGAQLPPLCTTLLSSSLQPGAGHPAHVSHYHTDFFSYSYLLLRNSVGE
jgi:hypothetical protein